MSKRISENLRLQLFCAVLISLLLGSVFFGTAFLSGNALLDKTVYGHSFASKMADQQFEKLQNYVEEESISIDRLQRLNAWCSRGEKVYLSIYLDDTLVYESRVYGEKDNELNAQEYDPNMEDPDNEYILTLHGDIKVRAFLYYYAGDTFYFWMTVISGLLAFAAFSLCFVVLISRKVSYITRLKEELDILSGGQLECQVTVSGKDELGELAAGIDQMRLSIIRHQQMEEQMRSANSELITAMSHDLRTPLTSLLAYLEILDRKKYTDEEQINKLIHKSVVQAMRIKQMADKLFAYFWAYTTQWDCVEMETVDASRYFLKIISDYAYDLESRGFNVNIDVSDISGEASLNPGLIQRAMDNIFSNILKYAATNSVLRFSLRQENNSIVVSISNVIKQNRAQTDSTGIGLRTCQRIIEYHNGSFSAVDSGSCFFVNISIPIRN